jgi:hypothetical protein
MMKLDEVNQREEKTHSQSFKLWPRNPFLRALNYSKSQGSERDKDRETERCTKKSVTDANNPS